MRKVLDDVSVVLFQVGQTLILDVLVAAGNHGTQRGVDQQQIRTNHFRLERLLDNVDVRLDRLELVVVLTQRVNIGRQLGVVELQFGDLVLQLSQTDVVTVLQLLHGLEQLQRRRMDYGRPQL